MILEAVINICIFSNRVKFALWYSMRIYLKTYKNILRNIRQSWGFVLPMGYLAGVYGIKRGIYKCQPKSEIQPGLL